MNFADFGTLKPTVQQHVRSQGTMSFALYSVYRIPGEASRTCHSFALLLPFVLLVAITLFCISGTSGRFKRSNSVPFWGPPLLRCRRLCYQRPPPHLCRRQSMLPCWRWPPLRLSRRPRLLSNTGGDCRRSSTPGVWQAPVLHQLFRNLPFPYSRIHCSTSISRCPQYRTAAP